jgi:activator of HSP90 ATPase
MSIHQEVIFAASADAIYKTLTNAKDFARMTGGRAAKIAAKTGGEFSMFGGQITGRHVELVPGKRVVQAWRSKDWPAGHYSIVHFELKPAEKGTALVFDQAGHPADAEEHLETGWGKMYWEPMKAMLAG